MSISPLRTDDPLPEADIHEILSNDRRRQVLKHLQDHPQEVSLRDLAVRIAEVETGESPPPNNIRNSVYVSLHQSHPPRLDEMGIVDYDADRKTISLRKPARQANIYMEVVTRYGITWSTYYRAFGTIALLTVVLSSIEAPLISALGPLPWATLFLSLIVISTVYQLWSQRWLFLLD